MFDLFEVTHTGREHVQYNRCAGCLYGTVNTPAEVVKAINPFVNTLVNYRGRWEVNLTREGGVSYRLSVNAQEEAIAALFKTVEGLSRKARVARLVRRLFQAPKSTVVAQVAQAKGFVVLDAPVVEPEPEVFKGVPRG